MVSEKNFSAVTPSWLKMVLSIMKYDYVTFLAAPSSSKSLVVSPSVCWTTLWKSDLKSINRLSKPTYLFTYATVVTVVTEVTIGTKKLIFFLRGIKHKNSLWQNSKTQIWTTQLQLRPNSKTWIVTVKKTWHLNNRWEVFRAAFRNSCNVVRIEWKVEDQFQCQQA